MITLASARALIAKHVLPLPSVTHRLAKADGRVLRQDVRAKEDIPSFDRSAMDGYAVVAGDPAEQLRVVAEIEPGARSKRAIRPGECARIFTGAPMPVGASRVLMQEKVRVENGFAIPLERDGPKHIRTRGEDACKGDLLLPAGTLLGAGELALLAGLGVTQLKLSPLVRVAHFATGNELVAPGEKLRPGQIRDSNSTLAAVLVRQFGGRLVKQERVADNFDRLLRKTRAVKKSCDLLLLSGGASVGDYDFGRELLAALGFQVHFSAVNLRPGKPLIFATRGRQAAFVLPGNPVSHLVTLQVAVRLAFERFTGGAGSWPLVKLPLVEAFAYRPVGRETFWPAQIVIKDHALAVRPMRWQSSGDVTGLAGVNAFLQFDGQAGAPKAGGKTDVLLLNTP